MGTLAWSANACHTAAVRWTVTVTKDRGGKKKAATILIDHGGVGTHVSHYCDNVISSFMVCSIVLAPQKAAMSM